MRLLLDTCTFIWYSGEPEYLSAAAAGAIKDVNNQLYFSASSIVELCMKYGAGKLELTAPPGDLLDLARKQADFSTLPFPEGAALLMQSLPLLHKDPFDRMLVCHALNGDFTIVTPDPDIRRYNVKTLW